jgi:hypothetical protein
MKDNIVLKTDLKNGMTLCVMDLFFGTETNQGGYYEA